MTSKLAGLLIAVALAYAPAFPAFATQRTGACGDKFVAPAVSSLALVGADDGTLISPANATGPADGWAAASLPVTLPVVASLSGNPWTACGTSENNKAVVFNAPTLTVPAAPVLSQTVGGSLAARTYFVQVTYTNITGETTVSAEATIAVGVNNRLVVAGPSSSGNATGWNLYVGTATNNKTLQNSSPMVLGVNFTEPLSGLFAGATPPTANSAASAYIVDGGRVLLRYLVGGTNYQTASLSTDGANYRVISASRETRLLNGATTGFPSIYEFPGGPGYQATLADNGAVITGGATSAGLLLTLPQTTTLPAGWAISILQMASKPVTVRVNSTNGGSIGEAHGTVAALTTAYNNQVILLQFDGAVFHDFSPPPSDVIDPRLYGAQCSSTVDIDAAPAINAAVAALHLGGTIQLPSCTLWLDTPVYLTDNIQLTGVGGFNAPGYFNPRSAIGLTAPASGSVLNVTGLVDPAVQIMGTGDEISHVNFNYPNQVHPSGANPYVPTTYPWTIQANGTAGVQWNSVNLNNLSFAGATHCIDLEGISNYANGTSTISSMVDHIFFNPCMNVGIRLAKFDNDILVHDLRYDFWWGLGDVPFGQYVKTHKIDMNLCYVANAQITDVKFTYSWRPMQIEPCTVVGGFGHTAGTDNVQMSNISFNETCTGIHLVGTDVETTGMMTNILAFGDSGADNCAAATGIFSGGDPVFFDMNSSSADWAFTNLKVGFVQSLAAAKTGANLTFNNINMQEYSHYAAGANAFKIDAGAAVYVNGNNYQAMRPGAGAGALVGPGPSATQGHFSAIQLGGNSGASGAAPDGAIVLRAGDAVHSGLVQFYFPTNSSSAGFLGYANTSDAGLLLQSDQGPLLIHPNTGFGGPGNTNSNSAFMNINSTDGNLLINMRRSVDHAGVDIATGDTTHTGDIEFFYPNNTRAGFLGHGPASPDSSLELQTDQGPLHIQPNTGFGGPGGSSSGSARMDINSVNGKLLINVNGLPISCSGLPTGTLWDNANIIQACP
jgi:hypothetical protein